MGGCLSTNPRPPVLGPYDPKDKKKVIDPTSPSSIKRNSWSMNDAPPNGPQKAKSNSRPSSSIAPAGVSPDSRRRDLEPSRSRSQSRSGLGSASSTRPPHPTPSSRGPALSTHSSSIELEDSWRDGAAAVAASSASVLALEERELADVQYGLRDVLEEQSIQAYDMDNSVNFDRERRYSTSYLTHDSLIGGLGVNAAESPARKRNSLRPGASFPHFPHSVEAPNPTILIVDEHASTRSIITKWFSSSKYIEISCSNGAQALEVLCPRNGSPPTHHVDVIICDVSICVNEGELLFDAIVDHVNPSIASIPVILLSSNLSSQGLDRLIRRGAFDVISKPLNKTAFLNALSTVFKYGKQKLFIDRLRQKGDEYKELLFDRTHRPQFNRPSTVIQTFPYVPHLPSPSPPLTVPPSPATSMLNITGFPSPMLQSQPQQPQMQPIQVLLIESDLKQVDLMKSWIESESVVVRHVGSILEAIPLLRESQKAAVLAASSVHPGTSNMPILPLIQRSISSGEPSDKPVNSRQGSLRAHLPHAQSNPATTGSGPLPPSSANNSPAHSGRTLAPAVPTTPTHTAANSTSSTPAQPPTLPAAGSLAISHSHGRSDSIQGYNPLMPRANSAFNLPALASIHFGIELIMIGHDVLIPPGCDFNDLAAPVATTATTDTPDSVTVPISAAASLANAQALIELSFQPISGKIRKLPFVVLCEEEGPSPIAMALLKHVALTIINAPFTYGLVSKKMGLLLSGIDQNRQTLLLARRAHMYKALLHSLVGNENESLSIPGDHSESLHQRVMNLNMERARSTSPNLFARGASPYPPPSPHVLGLSARSHLVLPSPHHRPSIVPEAGSLLGDNSCPPLPSPALSANGDNNGDLLSSMRLDPFTLGLSVPDSMRERGSSGPTLSTNSQPQALALALQAELNRAESPSSPIVINAPDPPAPSLLPTSSPLRRVMQPSSRARADSITEGMMASTQRAQMMQLQKMVGGASGNHSGRSSPAHGPRTRVQLRIRTD